MIVRDLLSRQRSGQRKQHPHQFHLAGPISRLTLEEILGNQNGRCTSSSSSSNSTCTSPQHSGCVNTLRFGHRGNSSLLLSGSDDATLKLWDLNGTGRRVDEAEPSRTPIASFDTGHTSNILSACFVRGVSFLASVSMRGEVRLTTTVNKTTLRINDHGNGAYDVQSIPTEPHMFWSCGADGLVRQYDLRSSPRLGAIDIIQTYHPDQPTAFVSMSFNPMNPMHIACGTSSDPIVRIYDRRKLSEFDPSKSAVVYSCGVPHVVNAARTNKRRGRVTSLTYNRNGTELLVSFSHDYVYLFDVSGINRRSSFSSEVILANLASIAGTGAGTNNTSSKKFKVAPSDWSDTGPNSSRQSMNAQHNAGPGARLAVELQDMLSTVFGGQEEEEESSSSSSSSSSSNSNSNSNSSNRETKEETKEDISCIPLEPKTSWIQPHVVYRGHRNCRTICKQTNFYGMNDEVVISGSDCGRIFFWEKKTGKICGVKESDTRVVNCIERRQQDLLLASSGIDHNIKLFSPVGVESTMRVLYQKKSTIERRGASNESGADGSDGLESIESIMQGNEKMLEEQKEGTTVRLPPQLVLRMLVRMRRQQRRESSGAGAEEDEADSED